MDIFIKYFIYFMIYSFLGWLMEIVYSLMLDKKLVNRGFLIGPYCPIYGVGAFAIFLINSNTEDPLSIFLKAIFICALLEYSASFIMEKLFKVRWWDYSHYKYNINGRICLETMIPFGLIALLLTYIIDPFVKTIVDLMPTVSMYIVGVIILVIIMVDAIISTSVLFKIRGRIKLEKRDNTEKIRKYMEKWISEKSVFYRRISKAFPKFEVFKKAKKKNNSKKNKKKK